MTDVRTQLSETDRDMLLALSEGLRCRALSAHDGGERLRVWLHDLRERDEQEAEEVAERKPRRRRTPAPQGEP